MGEPLRDLRTVETQKPALRGLVDYSGHGSTVRTNRHIRQLLSKVKVFQKCCLLMRCDLKRERNSDPSDFAAFLKHDYHVLGRDFVRLVAGRHRAGCFH